MLSKSIHSNTKIIAWPGSKIVELHNLSKHCPCMNVELVTVVCDQQIVCTRQTCIYWAVRGDINCSLYRKVVEISLPQMGNDMYSSVIVIQRQPSRLILTCIHGYAAIRKWNELSKLNMTFYVLPSL